MPPARFFVLMASVLVAAGATVLAAALLAPSLLTMSRPSPLAGTALGLVAILAAGARLWLLRRERR